MGSAREFALKEFQEYITYSWLARVERNPRRRDILKALASQERGHYEFWRRQEPVEPGRWIYVEAALLVILRIIFGITFVGKLMERGEHDIVGEYSAAAMTIEGEDRRILEAIIEDERSHEAEMLAQVDETIVKYMGALVLGLSDAIVEITGAHAGTLGTTNDTLIAGVIGLIVGVSASISMASASYLQTKHETGKSPRTAAAITGFGYMGAVALMSLPYFLTHVIYLAFAASISVGVMLALMLTFQGSVYSGTNFRGEFVQTAILLLGTAMLSYLLGDVLGTALGIRGLI
ncbi:MAG TPA: rubrerythrin family protein [Nitrososphaeria archaeon]|jgi:VIT1/CCC1 family predicted Fe2+/Mn2+ transporter|nr:MAG: rubrerythrin family protein [Nitrososphaera sp.]HEU16389.1 rubrerythrin family protein [Nitrososphaeria archaeon]